MGSEWGGVRVTGSSTSSRLLPLTLAGICPIIARLYYNNTSDIF